MEKIQPRIRTVIKTNPLYPLNNFPSSFIPKLAEHICALLAIRSQFDLEGKEWEQIFADCIGASWSPSNVGLDDVTHLPSSTAWGAKTVKGKVKSTQESIQKENSVRLISGRNSINYSYGKTIDPKTSNPDEVGEMVLDIYNIRVREVRSKFENLRTVVLIKDENLERLCVFEYETLMFIETEYNWKWNKRGNLEGFDKNSFHKFTWQPHGSQFTIVEPVPNNAVRLEIKKPPSISKEQILKEIGFNKNFYMSI
jgi:hypothetical protein